MKKIMYFEVKEPKTHFTCQHLDNDKHKRYFVQGTLETNRGKKTKIEVDFQTKTAKASNKLFKITWITFQEGDYYE